MPSPFPGMNPWIEQEGIWPDFHHRLIDRLADAIADQVGPRYLVKIEEHLYVGVGQWLRFVGVRAGQDQRVMAPACSIAR